MEIFDFLASIPYLGEVLAGLIAGRALALFVVNLTPSPKDDELVAKAYRYIEFAAGIVKSKNVKS